MPMGYGAAFAVTTELEDLKAMNITTFNVFLSKLDEKNISLDEFAQYIKSDEPTEEETTRYACAYATFKTFQRIFIHMFGVNIHLDYHDQSEVGDCHDDVNGAFFTLSLSDVYTLTEDADRLQHQLPFKISQFVQYG